MRNAFKHGHCSGKKNSPTFLSYQAMLRRCYHADGYHAFKDYGGRGITVCDRWRKSFINFLEDMGLRPNGTTLDRLDRNGNYEPSNCRWATAIQQASNRKNNHFICFNDLRLTISEWERRLNMNAGTLKRRIQENWAVS